MTHRPNNVARERGTARRGQVALGVIWLIDGLLQYQPYMFHKTFVTGVIAPNAVDQPAVIGAPITFFGQMIEPHVAQFNASAATLQVLIGLGLLFRRSVKPALVLSFVWAFGIWFIGQGFGLIFAGVANPLTGAPGAAVLYIVVGSTVWPRQRGAQDDAGYQDARRLLGARAAWAALWLGSAALWLLPVNDSPGSVHDAVALAPSGAGWLSRIERATAHVASGNGELIAATLAISSVAIGLAVLLGWHPRSFLIAAIALSIVYWIVGQGLGGVLTGHGTDVGTAPLTVLLALLLLAEHPVPTRVALAKPARFSAPAQLPNP